MIAPGTNFGKRGKKTSVSSSEESKWLELIVMYLKNEGGTLSEILLALGGAPSPYNTAAQVQMTTSDTPVTYSADSIHSISIQVISGTIDLSLDGGGSTVTYTAGSNLNFQATTYFDDDIVLTIPGSSTNVTNIQTLTS